METFHRIEAAARRLDIPVVCQRACVIDCDHSALAGGRKKPRGRCFAASVGVRVGFDGVVPAGVAGQWLVSGAHGGLAAESAVVAGRECFVPAGRPELAVAGGTA